MPLAQESDCGSVGSTDPSFAHHPSINSSTVRTGDTPLIFSSSPCSNRYQWPGTSPKTPGVTPMSRTASGGYNFTINNKENVNVTKSSNSSALFISQQ